MKKLLLVTTAALLLASCSGESSSSSRFIPPSETTSSSTSSSSSSTSASIPYDEAEARAKKIIADQSALSDYYTDYKMNLLWVEKSSSTESESLFIYSSKNDFYAAKRESQNVYLVTIDGTKTFISEANGEITTSTDEAVIGLESMAFEAGNLIKDLSLDILEGAFSSESGVIILEASFDEQDNFWMKVDTGTFLTSYHAYAEVSFSSTSLLNEMTFEITEGTYEGDHVSFLFSYGTTEEDRTYPSI